VFGCENRDGTHQKPMGVAQKWGFGGSVGFKIAVPSSTDLYMEPVECEQRVSAALLIQGAVLLFINRILTKGPIVV